MSTDPLYIIAAILSLVVIIGLWDLFRAAGRPEDPTKGRRPPRRSRPPSSEPE